MPTYSYLCESCQLNFDKILPMSKFDSPQSCPDCGKSPAKKLVTPINFVLVGNDWTGKNLKVAGEMRKKNERLDLKTAERRMDSPGVTLVPNVGGERVDSWSEASKLAASKGKDTSGYDSMARKEESRKSGKLIT
jgi:putative FmdB family regulatory protein